MKTSSKGSVLLIFLLSFSPSYSQTNTPFKMRYQSFVKGDMMVISNNIMNRVQYNTDANTPYYNHTNKALLNDEFTMDYIDIDEDESTFSSSSAELFFNEEGPKKIVYAGLYWSATYKYGSGYLKKEEKFVAVDPSRDAFNTIKIKLPNQKNYTDIVGQTIFDGIKAKEYSEFAPYAVYADITNYVKELSNISGVYTVANIKATKGMLSGGIAAGWTIFFVYEDPTMPGKLITSYDGFAAITEQSTDIVFNGLTFAEGKIDAKIACAALEGDNNLIGDQLLFNASEDKNEFLSLSNSIRKPDNFFNSCITIEDQYVSNRFPDSKNTLGYDSCLISIPNENNSIINNNSKRATVRLTSTGDSCFIFFTALSVGVLEKEETPKSNFATTESTSKKGLNTEVRYVPANTEMLVHFNTTNAASTRNRMVKSAPSKSVEIQKLNMNNQQPGYYLIANMYKSEQDTKEFIYYLRNNDLVAEYFTNPLNAINYVYLKRVDTEQEAVTLFQSKFDGMYDEKMQILVVNKERLATIQTKKILEKEVQPIEKYDIQTVSIPNQEKGYYIVSNVFAINQNATAFFDQLKHKGLNPKILKNTANNYKYIYLKKLDTESEAVDLLKSKVNNTYQDKIWILSVNNSSQ